MSTATEFFTASAVMAVISAALMVFMLWLDKRQTDREALDDLNEEYALICQEAGGRPIGG